MTAFMNKREKTFGWIFLALSIYLLPLGIVYLCHYLRLGFDEAQVNVLVFIVNFLLTALIFWKYLWECWKVTAATPGRTFGWMGIGFAVYYGGNSLVSTIITTLAPDFANANDASILAMTQEHFWLMFLGTVILVPVVEETLYRGLVFGALRRKCRWLAYVVSVVVFSALHVVSYIGVLSPLHLVLSFLQYLPGAFALALAYDNSGSIWSSTIIHMTNNMLAMIFMAFAR